jgi:ribosomal protein S12 methylthiotransferase
MPGDFIVRPLYIHPDHFSDDIIQAMKEGQGRLLPYFDIPFQSGDDKTILAMNRTGSYTEYSALVKKIRRELPGAVLRTTFLTGFPGESDQAADNTARFLQEIQPDWSGCFPYSREEDTPAYKMKPRVPAKIAKARANHLEELQSEITRERLEHYVGQELNILVEEIVSGVEDDAAAEGLAIGRAWFQAPEVDGSVVIRYDLDDKKAVESIIPGGVVTVKVLANTGVDLDSRFIKNSRKIDKKNERKFIF